MSYKHCLFCKKRFEISIYRINTAKYCSYACRNKGEFRKRIKFNCAICNKESWHNPCRKKITCSLSCSRKWHSKQMTGKPSPRKGVNLSDKTKKKISDKLKGTRTGKNNHEWKGDRVEYGALHSWVRKHFKDPNKCEKCGSKKTLQWSNISGNYERKRSDWTRLCRSCHAIEDYRNPKHKIGRLEINNGVAYFNK